MKSIKQIIINICVLAVVLVGYNVFASEFDPKTGDLLAPELLLVREDAQGNRVLMTVENAPRALNNENEMLAVIANAEANSNSTSAVEGGAAGTSPSEFDASTGTAAWYYWYYPTRYNYWYSYGYYSYYPRYTYTRYYRNNYYNYWYYYRW